MNLREFAAHWPEAGEWIATQKYTSRLADQNMWSPLIAGYVDDDNAIQRIPTNYIATNQVF